MDYVFISHASDDKKRLLPYLEYLLEKLPKNIALWIDSPSKIDSRWARNNSDRIIPLQANGSYEENIKQAVKEAGCVLLFWSKKAAEKDRTILMWEIHHAWRLEKLLIARLDNVTPQFDLVKIDKLQMNDLSRFEEDKDDTRFDDTIKGILKIIKRGPIYPSSGTISRNAPYYINRDKWIFSICQAGREMFQEQTYRHHAFISMAVAEDNPDTLVSRFEEEAGPHEMRVVKSASQMSGQKAEELPDNWGYGDLFWPTGYTIEDLDIFLLNSITDAILLNTEEGKQQRPILLYTPVSAHDWKARDVGVLRVWLEVWAKVLGELDPRMPIISLLTIQLKSSVRSGRIDKAINAVMKKMIEDRGLWNGNGSKLEPVCLGRMPQVTHQDALNWSLRLDLSKHPCLERPDDYIDRKFNQASGWLRSKTKTYYMSRFAKDVSKELLVFRI